MAPASSTSRWTSLVRSRRMTFPSARLTSAFRTWSSDPSARTILPIRHSPRGACSSTRSTRSPSATSRRVFLHLALVWRDVRYSLLHVFQNEWTWACALLQLHRRRSASVEGAFGITVVEDVVAAAGQRIWFGVMTSQSFGSALTAVKGRLLTMPSISTITVLRTSTWRGSPLKTTLRCFLNKPTMRSQHPP